VVFKNLFSPLTFEPESRQRFTQRRLVKVVKCEVFSKLLQFVFRHNKNLLEFNGLV